jgi:hypothetical protein
LQHISFIRLPSGNLLRVKGKDRTNRTAGAAVQ